VIPRAAAIIGIVALAQLHSAKANFNRRPLDRRKPILAMGLLQL
jgi:hypothetical protein